MTSREIRATNIESIKYGAFIRNSNPDIEDDDLDVITQRAQGRKNQVNALGRYDTLPPNPRTQISDTAKKLADKLEADAKEAAANEKSEEKL